MSYFAPNELKQNRGAEVLARLLLDGDAASGQPDPSHGRLPANCITQLGKLSRNSRNGHVRNLCVCAFYLRKPVINVLSIHLESQKGAEPKAKNSHPVAFVGTANLGRRRSTLDCQGPCGEAFALFG